MAKARGYEANLRNRFAEGAATECWEWQGHNPERGYPVFVFKQEGQCFSKGAHRAVYELLVGPIPEGLVLDHLCKNTVCVNPGHLEPVTQAENLHRSDNYVGLNSRKTHCVRGHEFTPQNTYHPPKRPSRRYCKACAVDRSAQMKEAGSDR